MHSTLQKAVIRLLAPLVRVLLRHGISHAEFSAWAKQTYVVEAREHFGIDGKTPSVSRLAIVTGINRKEVKRILDLPEDDIAVISKHNRAIRVVTGWLRDSAYHDHNGEPRALEYGDNNSSFNQLVRDYGGDVPARALLDELVRVGTVSRDENTIQLVSKGYVPHESEEAMLELYATSARDLLTTLEHNVSGAGKPRLQLSVAYDDIGKDSLDEFRKLSGDKAMKLLQELDKMLSSHDGKRQASEGDERFRTGLGVYLIEEPYGETHTDEQ